MNFEPLDDSPHAIASICGVTLLGVDNELSLRAPDIDLNVHHRQGERDIVIFEPSSGSPSGITRIRRRYVDR
ncbi:hypothetical protein EVC45_16355 [Paraburkholderia sp. UYCP14C]|uniref:hypothetical protein n=1 Tax=Paraburkholderia sp. UYCP14C TaxID=2511130 RepID=UPI001020032B|nr:hypothetical protein [Paraburkholderia sp. UYCP14C]RZF28751.1 hypothetical protein EVC45_16355 [Paraburkholderia sp. UYCP14C]